MYNGHALMYIYIIFLWINGGLHGDGECRVQYSRWLNVHGKLSDREHSEIKNTVMFSTCTVFSFLYPTKYFNLPLNAFFG